MRRLAFLLRPSWVILAAVVIAFAYLCFTVLAPWQLGKNTATSHRNQAIADSVRADPVDVETLIEGNGAGTEWRRVTAEGVYVPNSTLLVRLRHLDGAPAYSVLGAFKTTDGRILLVDRGLVASAAGTNRPPQIADPPAGTQRIEGRVRASEGVTPGKDPLNEDSFRQVYSIDTTQAMEVMEIPLSTVPVGAKGGYLQLSEKQPGAFTPTPLPQLDAGPYLSYGLQWLAFGIMAPLGLGYFVYAELRERRKDKAGTPGSTTSEPATPQNRLADRYGGDRS